MASHRSLRVGAEAARAFAPLLVLAAAHPSAAGSLPAAFVALAEDAVRGHPDLRAIHAQARAQRARIDRAGALPDPMVMLEWSMLPVKYPVSLTQTEMSGVEVSVQQEFPYPGKRGLAQEAERHGVDVLSARAADVARSLRGAVAQAYFELAFANEALRLVERNARVLHSLSGHAKMQVSAGKGLTVDVLRARTAVAQLEERRYALEARRAGATARLNVLLGRGAFHALPRTSPLGPPPSLPPVDELERRAEVARPTLRVREAELRRARAERARAERERYPNFLVGAAYRFRVGPHDDMAKGSDFYSLRFGVTLPIWGRQSAEAREAYAKLLAGREELESERRRVRAELHRLYVEFSEERRRLALYDDRLKPLLDATVRAAQPVYVAGRADFHALLETWARRLDVDLDRLRSLSALHAKAAEIETAVGAALGPEANPHSEQRP